MGINSYIAKQFSHPKGLGGKIISAIMNKQNRPLYEAAIQHVSPLDNDSILDIGCGNGYVLNILARQCSGVFTGIDISNSVIKAACKRNRKFIKDGSMTLLCQDAKKCLLATSHSARFIRLIRYIFGRA